VLCCVVHIHLKFLFSFLNIKTKKEKHKWQKNRKKKYGTSKWSLIGTPFEELMVGCAGVDVEIGCPLDVPENKRVVRIPWVVANCCTFLEYYCSMVPGLYWGCVMCGMGGVCVCGVCVCGVCVCGVCVCGVCVCGVCVCGVCVEGVDIIKFSLRFFSLPLISFFHSFFSFILLLFHSSLSFFSFILLFHSSLSFFSFILLFHSSLSFFSFILLFHSALSPHTTTPNEITLHQASFVLLATQKKQTNSQKNTQIPLKVWMFLNMSHTP
jgi:hypothetical protein